MSQDLVTISLAEFELQIHKLSFSTLKRLYEEIYQWKRNYGSKIGVSIPMEKFHDMERKQAKIIKEIQFRYTNGKRKPFNKDFFEWDKYLGKRLKKQ